MNPVPLTPDYAERTAAYFLKNRDFHQPYSPIRAESFYATEFWRKTAAESVEKRASGDTSELRYVILNSQESVIGTVNVTNIMRGPFQAGFIGFNLDQEAQGHGIMHAAVEQVLDICFQQIGLNRVMANYIPSNQRSEKLLKRLGFEKEGFAQRYLKINGIWQDHVLTSKLNPEPLN